MIKKRALKVKQMVLAEDLVDCVSKSMDKCPIIVRDEFMKQSLYPDNKMVCFSVANQRKGWLREAIGKVLAFNSLKRVYIVEEL